eukprot:COSAG05_NODE_9058_length_650_cov_1.034483_1_plen_171_part_01
MAAGAAAAPAMHAERKRTRRMMLGLLVVAAAVVPAAASAVGNCSDPRQYPPSPLTHKQHPVRTHSHMIRFLPSGCDRDACRLLQCADFCAGKCSFSPTPPVELQLTRVSPRGVVGIANKDTGDDQGDLFFTLISATKASECDKPNPPPYAGCFLAGDNFFEKYTVQVDGDW